MKTSIQSGLVSIMMPAYNAEQYIAQAIESVLVQSYDNWELIIVNDGSTDRTPSIVLDYSDPRIRVIHQSNGGESIARNTALRHMRGEFVAFLDADDAYLDSHLEHGVAYLNAHPNYDGVYSDGYHFDSAGNRLQTLSSNRRGPFEGYIFGEVVRASDVFGPPLCVILRRNLIDRFHLEYDSEIVIGPDWDFFIQYAELGKFGYIQDMTCLYRVHQTNITVRAKGDLRRRSLARCREKAIKLDGFPQLSEDIRSAVFYDLLINLLIGLPQHQNEIVKWPEFKSLAPIEQSRLLRLMASKSILHGYREDLVVDWLQLSQSLNPQNKRGVILSLLYRLHPRLCQCFLFIRTIFERKNDSTSPFSQLKQA